MSYVSNSQKLSINSSGIISASNVPQTSASSLITDLGSNNFRVNFSRRIIKQLSSSDFTLVGCTISSIVNDNQSALVTFSLTPTAQNYSVTLIADSLGEFSASNTVALSDAATVTLNSGTALAVDTVRFTATFNYPITQTLTSSIVSVSTGAVSNFSKAVDNLSVTFDVTTASSSFTAQINAVSGVIKQSNLVTKNATNYWYSSAFNVNANTSGGAPGGSVVLRTIGLTCDLVIGANYNGIQIYNSDENFTVNGVYFGVGNYNSSTANWVVNVTKLTTGVFSSTFPAITNPPAGNNTFAYGANSYSFGASGGVYTSSVLAKIRTLGY